jgi:hypothetical protein
MTATGSSDDPWQTGAGWAPDSKARATAPVCSDPDLVCRAARYSGWCSVDSPATHGYFRSAPVFARRLIRVSGRTSPCVVTVLMRGRSERAL